MSEKKLVVDQLKINYDGIFSVNGLYKLLDSWFYENAYDKLEKKNDERVTPNGKDIEIEMRPWKKPTDYANKIMKIRLFMKGIKDVVVEKDGVKHRLNQGSVQIIIDGYIETDYENKWEQKPTFFFIRALFDKYIFKFHTDAFEAELIDDVHHIQTSVKSFLNLYRYASAQVSAGSVTF